MKWLIMKNKLLTIIAIAICWLSSTGAIAQTNIIIGSISDANGGMPLGYTRIISNCLKEPMMADENGNFEIYLREDTCELEFFFPSYQVFKRTIIFTSKQRKVKLKIELESEIQQLGELKIVAKGFDDDPVTSTSSVMQIDPKSLDNLNISSANELVTKLGGVAVVDNEPQIRGGSGFSSGMGSRVMILLDDMPFLRPDAGRPMWNFIPMEDVDHIEVIKGAASVVFGSSALTGAINVLTAYPSIEPKTKVTLHAGIYDSPKEKYKKSWDKISPVKWGASFLHSRIIKKNFDFVIGGEFFDDQSYIGPEYSLAKGKSNEGKYETRGRINFGTRYRFNKVKGLVASLNGNFMYSENAQSFFWYDSDTNMYRTYEGSLSNFKDAMFYVDPCISYIAPDGSHHALRNRITYSSNQEATGAQDASSILVFDEYQFTKSFKRIGLSIIAGAMNMYAQSYGRVFNGDNESMLPARMSSDNFAAYVQLEEKFLKKKNLTLVVGGRWECYVLSNDFEQKPIFRAGINYQIVKSQTAFRASWGQGYRYPSIGEKFISISIGNYGFYPNPELVSETSWNLECGVAQPFKFGEWQGIIDIAAYYQKYNNYIEFAMGTWGTTGLFTKDLGFRFLNTGPATISGIDFSVAGEGKLSKKVSFSMMASYTYSLPITKNRKEVYYNNAGTEYTFVSSSTDTSSNVLKYRIQHMAKVDLSFTFCDKISISMAASYYSSMKNVDKLFYDCDALNPNLNPATAALVSQMGDLPFKGYYDYVQNNQKGAITFDAGITYNLMKNIKVSFVVKNILNKEYTLRPMYLESPRTYNLQFVYDI